jgi:ankyrin repeat protein
LIRCGADIKARTNSGLTMMHVASQGDQAYSLTYFRQEGLSINELDSKKSTPLHFACFKGAETSIYYLLGWGCDVNAVDDNGNTPLHIAVQYALEFRDCRAVKEMLIRGADRQIKNVNGRRPIDNIDYMNE